MQSLSRCDATFKSWETVQRKRAGADIAANEGLHASPRRYAELRVFAALGAKLVSHAKGGIGNRSGRQTCMPQLRLE